MCLLQRASFLICLLLIRSENKENTLCLLIYADQQYFCVQRQVVCTVTMDILSIPRRKNVGERSQSFLFPVVCINSHQFTDLPEDTTTTKWCEWFQVSASSDVLLVRAENVEGKEEKHAIGPVALSPSHSQQERCPSGNWEYERSPEPTSKRSMNVFLSNSCKNRKK